MTAFPLLLAFMVLRDLGEAIHDYGIIEGHPDLWHYADAVLWGVVAWFIALFASGVLAPPDGTLWNVVGIALAFALSRASLFSVVLNLLRGKPASHLGTRWLDRILGVFGAKASLYFRAALFASSVLLLWFASPK